METYCAWGYLYPLTNEHYIVLANRNREQYLWNLGNCLEHPIQEWKLLEGRNKPKEASTMKSDPSWVNICIFPLVQEFQRIIHGAGWEQRTWRRPWKKKQPKTRLRNKTAATMLIFVKYISIYQLTFNSPFPYYFEWGNNLTQHHTWATCCLDLQFTSEVSRLYRATSRNNREDGVSPGDVDFEMVQRLQNFLFSLMSHELLMDES